MDSKKFGNFNWRNRFKKSESGFNTNKTNPSLSISIHFHLLGLSIKTIQRLHFSQICSELIIQISFGICYIYLLKSHLSANSWNVK